MKNIELLQSMSVEELTAWLDKHGQFENSPWMKWFDKNYCEECEVEIAYVPEFDREVKCSWCELHGKCKYFQEMEDVIDGKKIIEAWLKADTEGDWV